MKVFISYAREDWEIAERVWSDLKRAGIDAWIDRKELLPGQNWKTEISKAIRASSHFIALLSTRSVSKQGFFHTELKKAIDVLDTFPEHRIYFIPVRMDECEPSYERIGDIHWADLFPSYEEGFQDIIRVLSQYRQNGNIPGSQQAEENKVDQQEIQENHPLKTKSSEEKPVLKNENKRGITAGDAEKSVLVSGDGNVINIIHQYEPEQKKTEQNEVIEQDKPVIQDNPPQHPKEAEKPVSSVFDSDIRRTQKQQPPYLKIILLITVVVSLIVISINSGIFQNTKKPEPPPKPKEIVEKETPVQKPKYDLRIKPIIVSDEDALKTFKLKKEEIDISGSKYIVWRPLEYIEHDYKDNGNGTITDNVTGLMWQKSSEWKFLKYVPSYIEKLNSEKYAGYSDWRFPTVDELKSLITREQQSNDMYIDPIFGKRIEYNWFSDSIFAKGREYNWFWSSDKRASGGSWVVSFVGGYVYRFNDYYYYVRAVRSIQ